MEYTDYQQLVNFYKTTLANGSKSFYFDNPFTGDQEEYRYVNPPAITPLGGGGTQFRVSFTWEQLP